MITLVSFKWINSIKRKMKKRNMAIRLLCMLIGEDVVQLIEQQTGYRFKRPPAKKTSAIGYVVLRSSQNR